MNPNVSKSKILVAPLNWGLGHATRCIPLIEAFLEEGYEVHLASDGKALEFLRKTYPTLPIHTLPSYHIQYGRKKINLFRLLNIAWNSARGIRAEKNALEQFLLENKIDLVVSDNRLGLYSKRVPCYYITHQLNIRAGVFSSLATYIHRFYYSKFKAILVPDTDESTLAGELSKSSHALAETHFLGPLSRLKAPAESTSAWSCDLLVMLSGPEPLRSKLERRVLQLAEHFEGSITLLRGLVESPIDPPKHVKVYSHLGDEDLSRAIASAKVILSRAGYSTILDLAQFGSRAILIPTPGQGEQEYLSEYYAKKGWAIVCDEETLDLNKYFRLASNLPQGIPQILTESANLLGFFQGKGKG